MERLRHRRVSADLGFECRQSLCMHAVPPCAAPCCLLKGVEPCLGDAGFPAAETLSAKQLGSTEKVPISCHKENILLGYHGGYRTPVFLGESQPPAPAWE